MHPLCPIYRILVSTLSLGAWCVAPSLFAFAHPSPVPAQDDRVVVRYFKEILERPLDLLEVAVHAPGEARRALSERLAALGVGADAEQDLAHGDLVLVAVPPARQHAAGVRLFIADLLADPRIPFATPVTLDELDAPRFAVPAVFVRFDERVTHAEAAAIVAASGVGTIVRFDRQPGNVHLVQPASRNGFEVLDAVAALADHPRVLFAECDEVIRAFPALIPNDPEFGNQWQLHNTGQLSGGVPDIDLNGPEAWDIHTGTAAMIVAILDNGIQQNHPDIHQLTPGSNMTNFVGGNGGPVTEYDNHGTAVAGLVSAIMNNGIGVAGICPGCRTVSIKIAYDITSGSGWTSQSSWVADGVYEAQSRGAKVTNSSFTIGSAASITTAYTLTSFSMMHFAAAGNSNEEGVVYPASIGSVHAITSINSGGTKAGSSNWGNGVMFCAPGVSVYTTDRTGSAGYAGGDYTSFSGTSAASPLAAGTAALVWSSKPSMTPAQVLAVLQGTAKDLGAAGYDTTFGHGLPRANLAIAEALFGAVCPTSGNCYASNGSPGCSVNSCCLVVCALDPFCCNVTWDSICAGAALDICTNCGESGAGSCYSANGTPGCNVEACCQAICAQDPFCCNVTWDGICGNTALDICTNCGESGAGSCYSTSGTPGCNDEACCQAICTVDPFCCNNAWDNICVNQTFYHCVPQNDDCGSALVLTTGMAKEFNTSMAGTSGPAHTVCNYFGDNQIHKDVWFFWTASCGGYMTVSTCGTAGFNTKLAVYGPGFAGGSCPSSTLFGGILLACNDNAEGCANGTSKITIAVESGTSYRIRLGGYNGASGTGTILVTCGIPNDVCADALEIFDGSTFFSTVGAATDGPDIADCDAATAVAISRDVWFSYTATCTGPLTVSTCNDADFNTKVAVWGQNLFGFTCPSSLPLFNAVLLGCNNNASGCSDGTSEVTVNVTAGQTYRIQVGGSNLFTFGHGYLTLTCDGNCPEDLTGDGIVDGADLGILLGQWGAGGSADLNGDGTVNGGDLGLLLGAWGACN